MAVLLIVIFLIVIFVGAGLLVVPAGMALIAVAWLLAVTLRFCVVRPVRRRYRQHQQRAAVRAEVTRIEYHAAAAALRLEMAATQAHADMARRARGR